MLRLVHRLRGLFLRHRRGTVSHHTGQPAGSRTLHRRRSGLGSILRRILR